MRYFTFTIYMLLSMVSYAQQDPIDTDRPDQTESVYTIPANWIQLEAGFNVQQNDVNNREYFLPTLLSKYGINSRMELRLITTVATSSTLLIPQGTTYKTALEPIEIGAKIGLWEAKKWIPKTSFLFHFAIPHTAGKENDIRKVAPNFRFTFQNTLTKKLAIGYNVGAEWDGESNTPAYIYTFAFGLSMFDKWYGYVEAFGEMKKGLPSQHSLDGGIAYNITNDCKADISSGFGIYPAAPSWYVALGLSVRWNMKKNRNQTNSN